SNTRLFDENDRARSGDSDQGEYPQFVTNAGGTTTAVVNTDGSYKYVGRLVIDFDAEGNIIPGSYDPDVSGAYATDQQGVEDLGATGLIDPEIQAVVNAIEAEIIATESNVFGVSDVFLNGNRNGVDTADDPDGVRSQETNLGDLTADANLAAAQAVDGTVVVSIKNGGGIRASIGQTIVPPGGTAYERVANEEILDGDGNVIKPAGGISENDIKTSLAFNNGLSLLTLTKAELVAVLEHAVGDLGGGRFPQVSGIKFSYDPDQPVGARIVNAGIFDGDDTLIAELVRDGAIVGDVTETFRIVTLNFLAGGGDGYPLDGLSDPQRVDLYDLDGNAVDDGLFTGDATFAADGTEQDALAEYLDDTYPDAANAFSEDDVGRGEDLRIQNLSYTDDTVFNDPDYGAPQPTEEITFEIAAAFAGDGGEGASEVVAHEDGLLYVTNGALGQIDIFDIAADSLVTSIPLSTLPGYDGVQSVAVKNGVVAAAIARAPVEQTVFGQTVDLSQPGFVALFDAETQTLIATVDVGVLPDQLTFSADGTTLLVAGEGEKNADSDYDDNPLGTVAIVDVTDPANPVANILDFTQFNGLEELARAAGIRIQEGVSFAADVEPEYTAIAPDGVTAFVSLQENNALAKIDIATGQILDVLPLGVTDFASDSELDAKDDDVIDIRNFANLVGFKMPDAIATFEVNGQTFIATANEGDSRDFDEDRVGDLAAAGLIDPSVDITGLERLEVSTTDGDTDGDGDIDVLHTFSSRSFSIYDADGNLVFDSGSDFERIIAEVAPERFNDDDGDAGQNRSDAKGPEPEAIAIGEIDGKLYAFIGLERDSGIMIYDVTAPENATFVNYIPPAFVDATPDGEVARQGPEVIAFISAAESTSGTAQIAVAYEISGTTVVYDLTSDVTKIHDIQGSSDLSGVAGTPTVGVDDVSPMLGQVVTIAAIVTADFQSGANGVAGSDLSGFFVQEEEFDYDGDALTSEGLFIFDDFAAGNPDVQVGDFVRITGTVGEYYGQTQISADTIVVVSSGNALPAATVVDLPTDGVMVTDAGTLVADLESVEGMVVTIPEAMTVSEMFNLDRYGEYRVSADGQPEQFTQSNAPDAQGYQDHLAEVAARSIVLDDGSTVQNPDVLEIIDGNNGVLDAGDSFRMGDTIANLTGVVQYSYDTFRLSDATGDYSQDNPRPDAPDDVGGDLKVASFNVLNFFTTLDIGSATTANGQDPRGADSQEEFDRQLAKLVNSITTIDADILGLVELENDFLAGSPGNAIEFLVDALNAELGSEVYAWVDPGTQFVGTDAISTGLIYKVDSVTQVGDAAVLVFQETSADTTFALADVLNQVASSDDRVEDFDRNRPAVAASFQDADGAVITVAVNHFKSKGDSNLQDVVEDAQAHVDGGGTTISQADIDALIADANYDQGDGQGFWNQVRVDAAGELATWLATDPTGAGDPDVLILGDLNAYAMEEPVAVLTGAGYADVAAQVLGDEASSYVFDGQTGTLDYALASASLAAQLTGATEWHINADEADAIDYNLDFGRDPALFDGDTPARTSDHDPVIVGFDLEEPDDGLTLTLVHARSHAVLAEVEDGSDIVLDDFASDDLTMLLEVDDASFRGSVLFELFQVDNGVVGDDPIVARFDNAEPYALFGDWRGHLWANDTLGEGDFMLRTTLYSRNFGRGDVVQVEETEFSITEPSAEDLIDVQFVNTHTDDILGSLVSSGSGLSFDASLSGTTADDLGILISVDSDDVESVRLTLFDEAGNELASSRDARDPYTLFGDRNWGWWGTDYRDGDVDIPSGTYRLDVELYEHNWGHDPLAEASFEFDLTVADDLLV
ncbi:MAG: ExeM/NucH family extracellular endonuclease, partial [Rhodospirillaceae bacterium]|nr:ExeM/NucH family extracellular endonuclease [Rhodospirillaceae bacterium]